MFEDVNAFVKKLIAQMFTAFAICKIFSNLAV